MWSMLYLGGGRGGLGRGMPHRNLFANLAFSLLNLVMFLMMPVAHKSQCVKHYDHDHLSVIMMNYSQTVVILAVI